MEIGIITRLILPDNKTTRLVLRDQPRGSNQRMLQEDIKFRLSNLVNPEIEYGHFSSGEGSFLLGKLL